MGLKTRTEGVKSGKLRQRTPRPEFTDKPKGQRYGVGGGQMAQVQLEVHNCARIMGK